MTRTTMHLGVTLSILLIAAGHAAAQAPGLAPIRFTPVVAPRPAIAFQQAVQVPAGLVLPGWNAPVLPPAAAVVAPLFNGPVFTLPTITSPTIVNAQWSPWGLVPPRFYPGFVTPGTVSYYEPGTYWFTGAVAVNPWSGSFYNGFTNTFTRRDGLYFYNGWIGAYQHPWSGAIYNPYFGTTTRFWW
jgi:hypothetical protein